MKFGADPNAQDIEGNTPIHLCLQTLFEADADFTKVKNIVKELIFSGAERNIRNKEGELPTDILAKLKDELNDDDYAKMLYILTPPKGARFLRMTRPIEKVNRNARC